MIKHYFSAQIYIFEAYGFLSSMFFNPVIPDFNKFSNINVDLMPLKAFSDKCFRSGMTD